MNPDNFHFDSVQYSLYEQNIGYVCMFDHSWYTQWYIFLYFIIAHSMDLS